MASIERPGVAGVDAPAFVERSGIDGHTSDLVGHPWGHGVAGVDAPAFVERWAPVTIPERVLDEAGVEVRVSPGLTLRPSLSAGPLFPATCCRALRRVGARNVSPGLTLRPSLSALHEAPRLDGVGPSTD